MSTGGRASRTHVLIAGALVAAFLLQTISASLQKSPVFDEPAHIAAGLSYISTRSFYANPQHPPLLKELSAISLLLAGIRWPSTALARQLTQGTDPSAEWPVGADIIASNGADRVMFWARLPLILLGGLLGVLIFLWGCDLAGPQPALAALFLYAFDPIEIAHSSLVATDAGVGTFTVLFLFLLWRYLRGPSARRLVWCGLGLGAALASKFSAVALLPIGGMLLFAGMWRRKEPDKPAPPASLNAPCPCGSGKKFKRCHGAGQAEKPASGWFTTAVAAARGAVFPFLAMAGVAFAFNEVTYLFLNAPSLYIQGLRSVNADHLAGHVGYLHGILEGRSLFYFAAAYLLKEPLATIILVTIGCFLWWRARAAQPLAKWFLFLPAAVLLVGYSMGADPAGVRYIIPVLPFTFLIGGLAICRLAGARAAVWRAAAAVLCVWVVVAAAGIYPDHLSYFNESACALEQPGQIGLDGGSRCGPLWLDDSNVDWGQGLKQLRSWLNTQPASQPIRLYYFGIMSPQTYGITVESRNPSELLDAAPGRYAVSANYVARLQPERGARLRDLAPKAIVGHAFYIYDVQP